MYRFNIYVILKFYVKDAEYNNSLTENAERNMSVNPKKSKYSPAGLEVSSVPVKFFPKQKPAAVTTDKFVCTTNNVINNVCGPRILQSDLTYMLSSGGGWLMVNGFRVLFL